MTKSDALRHPNWKMGAKITVDCATLMNKGLEIIEAMRLYDLPLLKVEAVIHRQSVVHSLVEFVDGAVLAQLGVPIIGTDTQAIRNAEDRGCFEKIMEELRIPQPEAEAVTDIETGVKAAARIG